MTAGQFLEPVSHEGRAHLIYTEDDLAPYYALNAVVRKNRSTEQWETEGKPKAEIKHRGETFRLAVGYDSQPMQPWTDESYKMDTVPLFRISIASSDRLSDGKPADQSSRTVGGTITIRPRWPDMKKEDGTPARGIPNLNSGNGYIDAEIQVSNIPHNQYEELLQECFAAFDVSPGYVMEPHESSNIINAARYVRVSRSESSPLYAADGPIARTHGVLEAGQSGYRKHVEDHRKIPGYHVTTTLDDERASDIITGHQYGKEVKHYYPRDPSYYDPSDALYHPKLEVGFRSSKTEETVYWDDLDDVLRELDETIFNFLEWSGLPVRADRDVFEDDVVFKATESHRSAKLVECPLPAVEDEQEQTVMKLWGGTTESDRDLIESLVADGGKPSREELADRTGYSYRTVRRFVDRCAAVVRDAYEGLSIDSKHKEQMLIERVRTAESQFRESVENAVMTAADAVDGRGRTKWSEVKQKYNISKQSDKFKQTLKVRYRPESRKEMDAVVQEIRVAARARFDNLRRFSVEIGLIDGRRRDIPNLDSWSKGVERTTGGTNTTSKPSREPYHVRANARAREQYSQSLANLPKELREEILANTPG